MVITEVSGDLFNAPQGYYLAHCISGDFSLGAGLAEKMNETYDMRFKLHKQYPTLDPVNNVGNAFLIDNVFNLVDKPMYYHEARLKDLENALEDMKSYCIQFDIHKLAIPKLGCGKDKFKWEDVKGLIESIFEDVDIDIVVYVQ